MCIQDNKVLSAGIGMLEVILYAALLPILIIAAASVVEVGSAARAVGTTNIKLDRTLRKTLRRLHDELIGSSLTAEDSNGNSVLDTGEDDNGNGRLDADWAIGVETVTFNRRHPNGDWSLPITYKRVGTDLIRATMLSPTGKPIDVMVARGISSFLVTESNGEVVVTVGVEVVDRGQTRSKTGSIRVMLRNK